jgi:NAD(P)-dependent dehydrogenase (short-subunit alcohol dehydrogenase family)
VNAVCPAIIETDMTEQILGNDQTRSYLLARHPIGRFGRPEEVAAAVLYLCSSGAAFTTGVVYRWTAVSRRDELADSAVCQQSQLLPGDYLDRREGFLKISNDRRRYL